MEHLRTKLREWGVPQHYVEKIEEQEIRDLDTLFLLQDSEIDAIFDKMGPRAIFKARLKEARNTVHDLNLTVEELTNVAIDILFEDVLKKLTNQHPTPNLNDNSDDQVQDMSTPDIEHERNNDDPPGPPMRNSNIADDSNDKVEHIDRSPIDMQTQEVGQKRKNMDSSGPALELKRLCMTCLNGKMVLSYYDQNKELDDDHRNLLAEVMLNDYLKDDFSKSVTSEVEKSMTDRVLKLFPSEPKEIWMSSKACARSSAVGRGKIITRYYLRRRMMKKAGLIGPKEKTVSGHSSLSDLLDIDDEFDNVLDEKLLWLTNNSRPWTKLLELWKETAHLRIRRFIASNTSVDDYLDTYPGLKDNTGYLLLEADFEVLFEKSMNLYIEWPALAAFIESKVPNRVKENINDTLTPEGKKIQTILSIPYLFKTITVAKKGKSKQWRPSREEVGEAILLHVKTCGDIAGNLGNRLQDKYQPYGLTLSPQAVVVGETIDSISNCYVRLNGVLYDVENPLKALDLVFKIMHVLDCKYPKESEREWYFLEKCVYSINLQKKNPLIPPTASVCAEYNSFKKKM